MWFRKKRSLSDDDVRAIAGAVAQAVGAVMQEAKPSISDAVATAMGNFLTASVESQSKNMQSFGGLLSNISEIASENAARALGKRRTAKAKRTLDGKFVRRARPAVTACKVGAGQQDATRSEIQSHLAKNCECYRAREARPVEVRRVPDDIDTTRALPFPEPAPLAPSIDEQRNGYVPEAPVDSE